MSYVLTDLDGKQYEVNGVLERGGLLFATMPENGDVPIYSIKFNHEFRRYYKDHISDIHDIREGGQGDNQGDPRGPG